MYAQTPVEYIPASRSGQHAFAWSNTVEPFLYYSSGVLARGSTASGQVVQRWRSRIGITPDGFAITTSTAVVTHRS